jgi:hypothetical protein
MRACSLIRLRDWLAAAVRAETSSTSCDQPIFVDHATDASPFSYAVLVGIDHSG